LVNTVTVNYKDALDSVVTDFDDAEVDLVHPEFTVTTVCLAGCVPEGGMAEWLVTVENTGDVRLDFTTDEPSILPFSLDPGEIFADTLTMPVPIGADSVCNDITVTGTIPFCGLPNEIIHSDRDCCGVCPPPCIEIGKTVECDTSKVGDEVTYSICIENCGTFDLTDVVVTDDLLGTLPGFPSTLTPGQEVCLDFPYTIVAGDEPGPVENQAHVSAVDACDGTTVVTDDSDVIEVVLVHPDFTVEKVCLDEPLSEGDTAQFGVTVENTGDVRLDFTTV